MDLRVLLSALQQRSSSGYKERYQVPSSSCGIAQKPLIEWHYETYVHKTTPTQILLVDFNINYLYILEGFVCFVDFDIFNGVYDFEARENASKDRVFSVEPGGCCCCDKELGSVGTWSSIRHADSVRSRKQISLNHKGLEGTQEDTCRASGHRRIHPRILFPILKSPQYHHQADLPFGS